MAISDPNVKRTIEEIETAIERVQAEYSAVPQYTAFGHNNWAERDYLIVILTRVKDGEWLEDIEQNVSDEEANFMYILEEYGERSGPHDEDTFSNAADALYWLGGGRSDLLDRGE